ncbi:glycoside hydrolase family 43 protein [Aestuariimicrobium sp. p3-SID1156]|uniref:glycoside hydrolase family 43 protein n=1 Tax=Aestuariimicrobium sp. p3-SID1156 TaxID=2916038 RepID=UPI00223C4574|nr:glycoside hydrolase family 43 protein [Aestuariimicrobium sp. p3-SID1156]MCT1458014.1 glycoside hydrolase family 43 protein [Aestuariimicrobium sp. p3-SID1156]
MNGFTNPVYPFDFPDPQVLVNGKGKFIAIATNGNGMNVQVLRSDDMVTWEQGSDALPKVGAWSSPGKVWAPEAIKWTDGTYRLYYTTRGPDPEVQAIGVAVSDRPEGPYVDEQKGPLVYEPKEGGSIDASPFIDSKGRAWLYWKNDGNAIGVTSWIRVQQLSEDGKSLVGKPTNLIKNDLPWEDMLVEGPAIVEVDGVFHLFYSGNGFWTDKYAVGHAVGDSPTGPFTKDAEPVLVTNDVAAGPGHNQLIKVGEQWWTVYHAWLPGGIGDSMTGRQMFLSRVEFNGRTVTIEPPLAANPHKPLP